MKIAFITRSTLYSVKGRDTFQILNTARELKPLGIDVDIKFTHQPVHYQQYDLLHFFNIVRPADIVCHINRSRKPFMVSPNLVNYYEYDQLYRKGIAGSLFRFLSKNSIEYFKTIARWVQGNDVLMSTSYLWKGHTQSIKKILQQAAHLLPNSKLEYDQLAEFETPLPPYTLVPNGIDPGLFVWNGTQPKDSLKIFSNLYFHGHSVGGTNPSLLEAMASRALIAAHDNPFNRAVLQQDAFYFSSLYEITEIIENTHRNGSEMAMVNNNLQKIQEQFNWDNVIKKYENFIQRCALEKMSRSLESSKL